MAALLTGYAVHENTHNLKVLHLRSSQAIKQLRNYIEECQQFAELKIEHI